MMGANFVQTLLPTLNGGYPLYILLTNAIIHIKLKFKYLRTKEIYVWQKK